MEEDKKKQDNRISSDENARAEAKNLIYQKENIERDEERYTAEEVSDEKVEDVNKKLSPDKESMDSRG
ncbi:hypothetical protein [Dysgonomonas sp. 520]|uniref:hypothetical protein n=1 Tax=Dysgonomonas sp. 520 TaxID=2302931 RepID=UPI0013D6F35A|nr:hypothetical protein [Dysgonomonas sp. 520]NDW08380.1 hypothetical protein [Dysgonomonas sp. 520]